MLLRGRHLPREGELIKLRTRPPGEMREVTLLAEVVHVTPRDIVSDGEPVTGVRLLGTTAGEEDVWDDFLVTLESGAETTHRSSQRRTAAPALGVAGDDVWSDAWTQLDRTLRRAGSA